MCNGRDLSGAVHVNRSSSGALGEEKGLAGWLLGRGHGVAAKSSENLPILSLYTYTLESTLINFHR